tara:strand:+ start:444 stop:611 length:168 start_codon:yes stop_codon:yes gene_type:complete
MKAETYSIFIKGKEIHEKLTQFEYMEIMEDLSIEFYQTGTPHPDDITTKIIKEEY